MDTQVIETQIIELVSNGFGINATAAVVFLAAISIWSIIWKGIALWKAARLYHKGWFIALLIINTVGILEIIYIFLVAKKEEKEEQENQTI